MTDWNRFRETQTLREAGHPAEALAELKALRQSTPDEMDRSAILQHEALCYYDLGQFDKEVEVASEAVRLLPEGSPARPYAEFCLACAHGHADQSNLAVQELRSFLQKHAEFLAADAETELRHDAQLRLIANLICLGHSVEPLSIANALKEEDISLEQKAELSYQEAQAHRLLARHDRALTLYKEAIDGPLDRSLVARSHFHIGTILYDRNEYSRALDEFKTAESLADPGNPDRDRFAGWVEHTRRAVANLETNGTVI